MLHREHGGMFARIGMIREAAAERGKAKTKRLQIRIMERQRKTGVLREVLCGMVPTHLAG